MENHHTQANLVPQALEAPQIIVPVQQIQVAPKYDDANLAVITLWQQNLIQEFFEKKAELLVQFPGNAILQNINTIQQLEALVQSILKLKEEKAKLQEANDMNQQDLPDED